MQTVDYKCPACNAHMHFNPKAENWICDYCGNSYSLENLKENDEKFDKTNTANVEMNEYHCADCGASIIADANTAATFCVYCKNTAILKDKLIGEFAPNYVIPFRTTKEEAIEAFKKVGKGKILMPKEFSNPKNIEEMTGIYIPFWLVDCKTSGEIKGEGKRVTTFTVGDYINTKTDIYSIVRGGTMNFDRIPADASVRFDDAIMNSIEPFDYGGLKEFNHSYLSGFLAEKYDVNKEIGEESTNNRAKETFRKELESQLNGYTTHSISSNTIAATSTKVEYVLLPVWMLNIKYNKKIYTFAMNGQTGKMIGDIPWSKKKAAIMFIAIFLVVALLLAFTIFGGTL